jgi:hypothetical protein
MPAVITITMVTGWVRDIYTDAQLHQQWYHHTSIDGALQQGAFTIHYCTTAAFTSAFTQRHSNPDIWNKQPKCTTCSEWPSSLEVSVIVHKPGMLPAGVASSDLPRNIQLLPSPACHHAHVLCTLFMCLNSRSDLQRQWHESDCGPTSNSDSGLSGTFSSSCQCSDKKPPNWTARRRHCSSPV